MTGFITNDWLFRCWDYEPLWILFFWFAVAFWVGCCMGSFLNVCIWRIPRGESTVFTPSHCPKCNNLLKWYDNMPIWGYLHLRGKCRYCREPISPRYLIMELLVGMLFVLVLLKTGLAEQSPVVLLRYIPMVMLCVTTFFIDRKHRIIPDVTTYPAIIWGIALPLALPEVWGIHAQWKYGLYLYAPCTALAVLLFLGTFAIAGRWIAGRDVLGWGDVKYLMAAGALTGIDGAVITLFFGSFTGLVYGIWLAKKRRRPMRRTSIPLGPFLAVGSLLWILAGEWIVRCLYH